MEYTKENAKLFRNNPVFSGLDDHELGQILAISKRIEYSKDDLVFSEDQPANYLFLVEKGGFSLSIHNDQYKIFRKGSLFGEIAIINRSVRTGAVWAKESGSLISICGKSLFEKEKVDSLTALKIVRGLAIKITNYLRSREQVSTRDLIADGEDDFVEFKSSLRWNIHTQKRDKAIEHASLKTIAAFLNSHGGTLLIGVNDAGEIIGLENDQFQNNDKMLLHLNKLIKDKISTLHTRFVRAEPEVLEGKTILRIEVEAATVPAYLKDGNDELFYIRTGPATTNLKVSKVFDYIRMRFFEGEI
ncbi:MAG: putative DNA binding domain-containing protein [Bacteroidetes bacterium]|jgi:CRP-like cAMP-binding protein|nr:putative DNA binding domain-containing protein [Bacteroidota bacterium]MDF1868365.1 putative DNA binding domain-containing protein [Saprospiraceae bacterium]